jgi:hypothetical protein
MEMSLPNPKAVLANEAFPKGSPKQGVLGALKRPRHTQAGLCRPHFFMPR